jgi:glycine cleavage system H lipoate-binding protein
MMPGISGLDLLNSLRASRPSVDVIIITGYPTIKTAVQAIKIGAIDYIPKPFTPNDLRSLVARAFKQKVSKKEPSTIPETPKGLFVMKGHTWLRRDGKNLCTVGVLHDFLKPIEDIFALDLLPENKSIFQGEVCARITDTEKNVHRIWSPVTGRITKVNEMLKENLSLLKNDPYQKGWLYQIESPEMEKDLESLSKTD